MNIGDYVTRNSHNNDIIFRIISIDKDMAILSGMCTRLVCDAPISDLVVAEKNICQEKEEENKKKLRGLRKLSRSNSYLTGKILHIDSDDEYLEKCLELYRVLDIPAYGITLRECEIKENIISLIDRLNPDVVVLTGHDSYNNHGKKDLNNYRNTGDFVLAVKEIRKKYSKDHVFVFAGACQSNFEALIASGANFASSPKRLNIDAYDPAIIAIKASTTPFTKIINYDEFSNLIDNDRDGIGGIESFGKMRLFV